MQIQIFIPVFAMVVLTILVWLTLYRRRVREMRRSRISPQKISTSKEASAVLTDVSAADNFRNLFEVPVLFYVVCICLYVTGTVSVLQLGLAWLYVLLRYVHSFIHITYNKVMHRFSVYLASCLILWIMWGIFAAVLITGQ